ncbi:MAG: glycosyl hydrolase family 28 protein, partial [Verrucomicrobiota bacterium]
MPSLPNINTNNLVNITSFGAVSSTTLTNTTAIQNAINSAATTNGGCTVEIPAGTYLSGPLTLKSSVNLQIDSGATLQMLPYAKWSGTTTFITGSSLSDVMISGLGTIDGNGYDWWVAYTNSSISRPNFINFTGTSRILIEGVTLQNPPTFHLMLKGGNTDITIQSIIINTPPSKNTDGMDLGSSNILVQNSYISDGDDNIEIGGSSDLVANLVVTNCNFGIGHGVSMGSYTQGCISNVTVVNCTFTNTDYGIRIKSDYDRGGIIQNLSYCSNRMSNIKYAPILIYSYYNSWGNPTISSITPGAAAATNAITVSSTTPRYRNILISNLWASAAQPGMIWARTEMPATNIILQNLDITATGSYQNFEIYNAKQVQIVDSQFHLSAGATTNFWLYNADVTFTNTSASTSPISLYGVTTNSYINKLAFYNSQANVSATNTIGAGPLTLADSILAVSNNFALFPTTVLNYVLDTNINQVAVVGNLAMGGTINVTTNTSGFSAGTNTLLTYTGTLSGALPTLGSTPGGSYTYSIVTNTTSKLVGLAVVSTSSSTPTTTSVQPSANPSTYGNTVMFTATVSPAPTNGETVTFKDGSTTLGTGTLSSGQATYTTTATQLAAGSHSITAVYAGDGAYGASTSIVLTQTVNARALTVTGLTVNSKTYDRTMAASLSTNGYTLSTVISGDTVTLVTNGYTATFA